jgi:CheY-like chemotaxis protein
MSILINKHIFVVEDDATNLAVVSALLRQHGAKVTYDRWGQETIEKLVRVLPVDLILLDLMFPGKVTGYEIFEQIKSNTLLASIPAVVVSASDPDVEMKKAQAAGFSGYLCKPINRRTFTTHLVTVINGQSVWDDEFV